jgi:hypothetical protein
MVKRKRQNSPVLPLSHRPETRHSSNVVAIIWVWTAFDGAVPNSAEALSFFLSSYCSHVNLCFITYALYKVYCCIVHFSFPFKASQKVSLLSVFFNHNCATYLLLNHNCICSEQIIHVVHYKLWKECFNSDD